MSKILDPRRGEAYRAVLRVAVAVSLALSSGLAVPSAAQTADPRDLTRFSLEDLMNVQVTSVSKKDQRLAKTGAAVFVITPEDIRRSGATNIPDLLRMVPGVDVARMDHSNWAISIRGFNDVYANKVLVLIDGRSVYHPIYSGVVWYAQDVPLEDIERIEVIRGPGGTVWGANAMNGVINIITKSAKDTLGGLLTTGGGSSYQMEGLVQYGGKAGQNGAYRVYGRYSHVERPTPWLWPSRTIHGICSKADFARTGIFRRGICLRSRANTIKWTEARHSPASSTECLRSWVPFPTQWRTTAGIFWHAGPILL
jgi:outer membrane receptor protein involved in Fe transport